MEIVTDANDNGRGPAPGTPPMIGIIGGSGLYSIPLENVREERVTTPWGEPSDALRMGTLAGVEMGLAATGVPHRKGGAQAALDYLASPDAVGVRRAA